MARSTVLRVGGLIAAIFVLAGGANGAAATSQPDLSSRAAIASYLQSIGVDPATVTWQQGLNNYAGPSCPGVGWTCTTAARVVQMAPAAGQNSADCSESCLVFQTTPNGSNHAKCEEHSTDPVATQDCDISQASPTGSNDATVLQDVRSTADDGAGAQKARQTAQVDQQSDTGDNHADVHQSISQSLTFGVTQTQDGYQAADIVQSASDGSNLSHVHQTKDQQASGGTTQMQNTTTPQTDFKGCAAATTQKPFNPDQCAHVQQENLDGGTNGSQLDQAIGDRQSTNAPAASQTQGTFAGGQKGGVHQDNPFGVGQNMNVAHQALAQRQSAPADAAQTQLTDPGCCGASSQDGGAKNHEDINQSTTQSATGADAEQFSTLSGIVRQTSGGDAPVAAPTTTTANDTCDIDQHGRNNDGSGHFSVSGTGFECEFLTLETVCQSGVIPDSPVSSQPASEACGPPVETGTAGVTLPALTTLASTPTAGQPIGMPDYGTPTDYLAAIGG